MKLPNYRRIMKSDYAPEQRNLVERLSSSINIAIETLNDALNRKLTITDNIASTVAKVIVMVDATGKPVTKTQFKLSLDTPILGLEVINAENLTNTTGYPTAGVFISYSQSSKNVVISNVAGLIPNNEYQLTVLAWHN